MKLIPASDVGRDIRQTVRKPAHVFKSCPQCESPNLVKFDDDVFCAYCSWDSVLLLSEESFSLQRAIDDFDSAVEREEEAARKAARVLSGPTFPESEPSVA